MKRILFVCTGNTCRSPLAEAFWNKLADDNDVDIGASSCGLCTVSGLPASENSILVAKELSVDLTQFRSTVITDVDLDDFTLIAVMTESHARAVAEYGVSRDRICVLNGENGGISDPYGYGIETYRVCRDEIIEALKTLMDRLR